MLSNYSVLLYVLINLVIFHSTSEYVLVAAPAPGPGIQQQTHANYLQLQVILLWGNLLTSEVASHLVLQLWVLAVHINTMEIKPVVILSFLLIM